MPGTARRKSGLIPPHRSAEEVTREHLRVQLHPLVASAAESFAATAHHRSPVTVAVDEETFLPAVGPDGGGHPIGLLRARPRNTRRRERAVPAEPRAAETPKSTTG